MVLPSGQYATICSQDGDVLAKRAEVQEREVAEVDGIHLFITALLSKGQASKMTVGTTYLIRIGNSKSNPGSYKLIRREDESLPLRRHTFRSEGGFVSEVGAAERGGE